MLRGMLAYGITEDLQVSLSIPYVFSSAPFAPARITGMMPASGDVEAIGAWRFHRQGPRVGTRFESTAYAGIIEPGLQRPAGMLGKLHRAPGFYTALSTGVASRSHYVWGGVSNMHFVERLGDRRPNVVTYSAVWGWRKPPLQKDIRTGTGAALRPSSSGHGSSARQFARWRERLSVCRASCRPCVGHYHLRHWCRDRRPNSLRAGLGRVLSDYPATLIESTTSHRIGSKRAIAAEAFMCGIASGCFVIASKSSRLFHCA